MNSSIIKILVISFIATVATLSGYLLSDVSRTPQNQFLETHRLRSFDIQQKTESSLARLRVTTRADAAVIWGFFGPLDPEISPQVPQNTLPLLENRLSGILSVKTAFPVLLSSTQTALLHEMVKRDSVYVIFPVMEHRYLPVSDKMGAKVLVVAPIFLDSSETLIGYVALYYIDEYTFFNMGDQKIRTYLGIFRNQLNFTFASYKE